MADKDLQQLVINVGTTAQIEAAIAEGTITEDMLSVATDSPEYATQTWVRQQGFITSASLPTKLSDLKDDTATTPIARATSDASGNAITTTYATKTELAQKSSFKLFHHDWFDYQLNDMDWLRADTFSWQDGEMYSNAYDHLVADISGISSSTETIGSYTITYYLAADGHKICLPDQETTVANIYNESGVAWYYILDTINQRFKLPRENPAREELIQVVRAKGNGKDMGLTSGTAGCGLSVATGATRLYPDMTNGSGHTLPYNQSADSTYTSGTHLGLETDSTKSGVISDMTDSIAVYKGKQYLYFYVGQFSQTATEQTAGLNSELFNGKADIDLSNAASNASAVAKETIVGWGAPDYSSGISLNYTNTNTNFPINGIAYFGYRGASNTSAKIYINDQEFGLGGSSAGNFSTQTAYRVSTTDVYRFETVSNGQFGIIYPLKGNQNA